MTLSDDDDLWTPGSGERHAISFVTRRDVFDYIPVRPASPGSARWMSCPSFGRLYDLDSLPSDRQPVPHCHGGHPPAPHQQRRLGGRLDLRGSAFEAGGAVPDDALLEFLVQMVHPVVRPDAAESAEIVRALNDLLRPDGWRLAPSGDISGRPIYAPLRLGEGGGAVLRLAHEAATRIDSAYISRQVTRMEEAMSTTPELAIGTAKDFVEAICKTVLDGLNESYAKNDDLPALVKKTTKALRVSRDDIDDTTPAAETIRRMLSSLAQIAQGTAELRNASAPDMADQARRSAVCNQGTRVLRWVPPRRSESSSLTVTSASDRRTRHSERPWRPPDRSLKTALSSSPAVRLV